MICAALGEGVCELQNTLVSEDTEVMIAAWRALGLQIDWDESTKLCRIAGCGGKLLRQQADLYVANSGTSIRFLAAALAAVGGRYTLDGVPRMRSRPIGDLIDALNQLGGGVCSLNGERKDCPPVLIESQGLAGGRVTVGGEASSQFLSGLMMAAPYASTDVHIDVTGELVSRPYVAMTIAVMRAFGVDIQEDADSWRVSAPQMYRAERYAIEPDASAASYFLAAAAITGGTVTVEGLGDQSLQGDTAFIRVLERMGCEVEVEDDRMQLSGRPLHGIDIDMNAISDTVQTLSVVAAFADGPTRVRGVAHNRFKETDRIGDLARELRRVGLSVDEHDDGLTIHPGQLRPAVIQTYHDHRMAMSLSLLGLRQPDIWIDDPGCTAKTYPDYFDDMRSVLGLEVSYR